MDVFQHLIERNFIYPMRIIHKHLPIPFLETYCRLAFIAIAWIQEIYFSCCSPKKGLSNEFLLGESKCHGGILLCKTGFTGRKNVKQQRFFKRHINLCITSRHTNNKRCFGILYFQSALKCWHSLEGGKSSEMCIFISHLKDGSYRKSATCSRSPKWRN